MVVDEKQSQPPAATTIIYERAVLSIAVVIEKLDRGRRIHRDLILAKFRHPN